MENVKYKICYWYHEYQDMSASVPTCDYYRQYGKCPCEPECEHFITKKEVDDIVRNMGNIGQMSDLISREDAIKAVCTMGTELERNGKTMITMVDAKYAFIEILEALPSADDEQETVPTVVRVTMSDGSQYYLEHERDAIQADAVQGWIPVSEGLPEEENKKYWICTDDGYQCECRWTNVDHFWTDLTTDWHWHIMDIPQYSKVVAWMPLPEPYERR